MLVEAWVCNVADEEHVRTGCEACRSRLDFQSAGPNPPALSWWLFSFRILRRSYLIPGDTNVGSGQFAPNGTFVGSVLFRATNKGRPSRRKYGPCHHAENCPKKRFCLRQGVCHVNLVESASESKCGAHGAMPRSE